MAVECQTEIAVKQLLNSNMQEILRKPYSSNETYNLREILLKA